MSLGMLPQTLNHNMYMERVYPKNVSYEMYGFNLPCLIKSGIWLSQSLKKFQQLTTFNLIKIEEEKKIFTSVSS
jgi:hypothetical protein